MCVRRDISIRILVVIAALPWAASLACVVYQPAVTRPTTLGQELISLDQARKDGLLTQEEYDTRRAETIELWKRIGDTPIEEPRLNRPVSEVKKVGG